MAFQIFMKVDGVSGDSKHFHHKGWSEVQSWTWGMSSNRKSTEARDDDKTLLNEISVIKPIGTDSAALRLLFARRTVVPKVELSTIPVVTKRESKTRYTSVIMEDVVIKSIVTGGAVVDEIFKEHLSLLFSRVTFVYTQPVEVDISGVRSAAPSFTFGWDVPGNTEWTDALQVAV